MGKLRTIPDTVEEFVGYSIDVDFWAWTVPGVDASRTFTNGGKAHVRNVTLPGSISHVVAPVSAAIPENAAWRAWVEAYSPSSDVAPPPGSPDNIGWAADVWWTVKKYWVIEAQRYIRAMRARPQSTVATTIE
jgi:hypothetical protein